MIRQTIIQVAKSFVGQKETAGNSGFVNADFLTKMLKVGWQKGFAWCAFFAELVWTESYKTVDPSKLDDIAGIFSGSAVETFSRFKKAGWKTSANQPEPGDIVIWRHGDGWQGHAGIVTAVAGNVFQTVEGNTNADGGREGDTVAQKTRKVGEPFKAKGLNLVGFIKPA